MLSGEMTKKEEALIRLNPGLIFLGLLVPGLGVLIFAFYNLAADRSLQVCAVAFLTVVSAAIAGFTYWDDRNLIVRFVCSEASLQFCTLGTAAWQERTLADIAALYDRRARGGSLLGYWLVFRGGTRVCLSSDTAGAAPLAEHLRTDCQLSRSLSDSSRPVNLR
jgi:hypothetical protein